MSFKRKKGHVDLQVHVPSHKLTRRPFVSTRVYPIRILIIGDKKEERELLSRLFSSKSLALVNASYSNALSIIEKNDPFHLIIVDWDKNTESVFEALKKRNRNTPFFFVIMSGDISASDVISFYEKIGGYVSNTRINIALYQRGRLFNGLLLELLPRTEELLESRS